MRKTTQLFAFATLLSTILGSASGSGAVEFAPAAVYSVGAKPDGVVVGDFNADGKPDIAVANAGSSNVSILLGNGDGTFLAPRNLDLGATSGADLTLAAGDFNGDHKLDLVVYIHESALRLYPGNNDGTFQSPVSLSGTGTHLFAADVNLDGKLDLIADSSLLLGNGNGTFQTAPVLSISPDFVGDVNGDGSPDLVAGSENGITILLGNGDGTFQDPLMQPAPNTTYGPGLLVGDFDGDQKLDFALWGRNLRTPGCKEFCISVPVLDTYKGSGDGHFTLAKSLVVATSFGAAADFNQDGKGDLLFLAENSGFCPCPNGAVLLGPTFQVIPQEFSVKGPVVAADLNGDGLPDLVVVDTEGNTIDILRNTSPSSGADIGLISPVVSPDPAAVGLNLTYALTVVNEGPADATGVVLTDTLPNSVSFVSAVADPGACVHSRGVINCNIGPLASAFASTVTVVTTPTAPGTVTDSMAVSANEPDLASANNSVTLNSSALTPYTLAVTISGGQSGRITAHPASIDGSALNCPGVCSARYLSGTPVTLNFIESGDTIFGSWGGACAGTKPDPSVVCSIRMDADRSVTATFASAPDFTLNPTAASLSMKRGAQVSEMLTFSAQGGFSGTIALACSVSGPTPMPTCGIAPASVAPGNSATLTVSAPGLSATFQPLPRHASSRVSGGLCVALGFLTLVLLGGTRKEHRRLAWTAGMLAAVAILPAACGGGSSAPISTSQPQNYSVTITATSGAIQHSTSVSVTVK
jgi:uncharacterized repeat protein (TIGR01451 family)